MNMSEIISRLNKEDLQYIYDTYSYDNIFNYTWGSKPYYPIPPQLIVNKSEARKYGLVSDVNEYDFETDNWVFCTVLKRRLLSICNMTPQEYFDLIVLHINDTEERPKCDYCGIPLTWAKRVSSGYGSTGHAWNESDRKFCCSQHIVLYRSENREQYPKFSNFVNKGGGFGMMHDDPDQYGPTGTCDPYIHTMTMKSKFMNQGRPDDHCYLYITKTSDKFKFGISADPEGRNVFGTSFSDYGEADLRVVLEGSRYFIADVEAEIKLRLGTNIEFLEWERVPKFVQYFGEVLLELKDKKY